MPRGLVAACSHGPHRLDRYAAGHCHDLVAYVRTPVQCSYKEVEAPCPIWQPECWSAGQESLYLLEGLFPFRSSLQGVLTRPCCGFTQRLGNFTETRDPDPAASGSPEELTYFFLGIRPRC